MMGILEAWAGHARAKTHAEAHMTMPEREVLFDLGNLLKPEQATYRGA